MANIFISHRRCDMADAERLATELRNAGHMVWLDKWNMHLGDSIVERMNEGLESASFVIVCYSSAGILSPWMKSEWMTTLARQLNGCSVKLLPVVFSGGQPPAILADIKYEDLAANWSQGISNILNYLGTP